MSRFPRENDFDAAIALEVAKHSDVLDVPLVKAVIATESGFSPSAFRAESHLRPPDGSHGLMQILYRTAQGTGFTGAKETLFDPSVNIAVGTRHLASLIRARNRDRWSGVSAYNNGNGKRAVKETTVCLERNASGECTQSFTARVGQFFNQPYVDKVQKWYAYFSGNVAQAGGGALALLLLVALVLAGRVRGA